VVQKLDDPLHKEVKNKDGKTAQQLFKEEHKTLRDEAKDWIKDRSNAGMIVATLIATITFAAVITVPGGINQEKGKPIFLSDNTFKVFVVSDVLAFFFSMVSLLMFLSAINGCYTEGDFMRALPIRLVFGSNFLLFAVVAATVAFNAALSMLLLEKRRFLTMSILSLVFLPFIQTGRFVRPGDLF
jgi:ABC-type multidrug transport system fused ATPase/permease subunit